MLEAYYAPDKTNSLKFRNALPMSVNKMFKFFKENKNELKNLPLYFELLNIELEDLFF